MKRKGIISILLCIILSFSFLFSGCFDNNGAKNSAEVFCSFIFKSDADNLQKIGVSGSDKNSLIKTYGISDSDKDNLIKEYQDKIKEQLKKNFLMMGYSASDDQLNSVCDAYKEALAKITYDTKQISKSGDEAEVEISTTNFDAKKIDEQAALDAFDETDKMEFASTEEESNKFSEIYLNKLTEGLKNADISSEKTSNTFKFKKVNKYWLPDDEANFGYRLAELATNKDKANLNIDEESISPKESAEIFWNLVIKQDSSSMEKLGYSKAFGERILKNINKTDFKTFKKQFQQSDVSLSDDQIQGIIKALYSALSKNSATFEEVSKADNTAQVKVSSTSINMNSIINKALNTTNSQIRSGAITNQQKAVEAYAANLIDEINKAQASSSSKERTFNFTKMASLWVPSNTQSYVEGIAEMGMK